jgi:ribosomal protein S12 methylthiotransferase accessory factor
VYSGNGLRAVPLERTLADLERYFLTSGVEAQFSVASRPGERLAHSVLGYLSPAGPEADERYFGKGASDGQSVASACMEFIERAAAKMRPDDSLVRASFADVDSEARDPRLFSLAVDRAFEPGRKLHWCWGYSLTRSEPVLVPADLVFYPFLARGGEDAIAWTDTNGLASGNTVEEAVLHALLEVVERDAAIIAEYNRLPRAGLRLDGTPGAWGPPLASLEAEGFVCAFAIVPADHPIHVVSAFVQRRDDPKHCAVAFGCCLDPAIAVSRALTEAVQVLPPSVNHGEWLGSGGVERCAAQRASDVVFSSLENLASRDLKEDIDACVTILNALGAEVIVVDLSAPDIPFPVVRVLVTGFQPLVHEGDRRFSHRLFDVPVKLGLRREPIPRDQIEIWPLCGYR